MIAFESGQYDNARVAAEQVLALRATDTAAQALLAAGANRAAFDRSVAAIGSAAGALRARLTRGSYAA